MGLGPRREAETGAPVEGGDLDVGPEDGPGHRDRPVHEDVAAVPLERRVLEGADEDGAMAGWSARVARLALPGQAEQEAVRCPGGDLDVEGRRRLDAALPTTRRARALRPLPTAPALRARGDADELGEPPGLAPAHLALAVARRARHEPPALRPRPPARLAGRGAGDLQLLSRPPVQLVERDADRDLEVASPPRAPPGGTPAEEIREEAPAEGGAAEEGLEEVLAEQVPDVAAMGEAGPVEVLPAPDLLLQPLAAVRVVDLPLLVVREDLVRLGELLEPLLRDLLVALRHVRVVFLREAAVRPLDLVRARGSGDPEDVVVVPLSHGGFRFPPRGLWLSHLSTSS